MTILQELFALCEKKWSADVDTNWEPPEGFFKKSAVAIAVELKAASKDLKQAMSRLNFYINRAGKNLSAEDKAKLEDTKKELHGLYESVDLNEAKTVYLRLHDDIENQIGNLKRQMAENSTFYKEAKKQGADVNIIGEMAEKMHDMEGLLADLNMSIEISRDK